MANYTTIADLDLEAVANGYLLHGIRLTPLNRGAANSSFHLIAAEGEFVLTILDNHDPASAQQLATHTQQLHTRGIPTTEVILNRHDNAVTLIENRPVLLKRWIEVDILEPLPERLLPAAGGLLAALHNLPTSLPNLPTGTRRLSPEHHTRIAEFEDKTFAAWLTEQLDIVQKHEARHHRSLVICHGDLFADNLIHRPDDSLAVIDWETVSLDDPLLDLGMAAVGLAQRDAQLSPRRLQLLVDGYTQIRPLPAEDLEALPIEITHAALIIAFHRYYRHNIRFPNPTKANIHHEIVDFVNSLPSTEIATH